MRPLFHPAIDDVTVESILHALADPARVAIFASLAGSSCAQTCTSLSDIGETPTPKSTLSQHFKILREGGLIRSERRGVELLSTSRCPEIEARFPGLLPAILNAQKLQLAGKARARAAKAKRTSGSPKK